MPTKNASVHDISRQGKDFYEAGPVPQYEVDVEKRLVWVTYPKKVTLLAIEIYVAAMQADPLFNPDFSEIVDLTHAEEIELSGEQLVLVADRIDPFSEASRRAFVVRNTNQKHWARMHKILRGSPNISIFESIEEALKWIAA